MNKDQMYELWRTIAILSIIVFVLEAICFKPFALGIYDAGFQAGSTAQYNRDVADIQQASAAITLSILGTQNQ